MRLSAETIPLNNGESEVHIHADRDGIDYLIRQLGFLGATDHIHLFAESWGGQDLTQRVGDTGAAPVAHIKVVLIGEGWRAK